MKQKRSLSDLTLPSKFTRLYPRVFDIMHAQVSYIAFVGIYLKNKNEYENVNLKKTTYFDAA